jgi:hypothetical protein
MNEQSYLSVSVNFSLKLLSYEFFSLKVIHVVSAIAPLSYFYAKGDTPWYRLLEPMSE